MKKLISENEFIKLEKQLFIDYLEQASPKTIHQILMEWKMWTSWLGYLSKTIGFFEWIANNPKTDKATALRLVWGFSPTFRRLFKDVDEYVDHTGQSWSYFFGKKMEEKYINGFYTVSHFAFDPNTDSATVHWEEKFKSKTLVKPPVPSILYKKIDGETVEPPTDFISGMPKDLYEKWHEFLAMYEADESL